jgi:Ca-activated chloride channel family protein
MSHSARRDQPPPDRIDWGRHQRPPRRYGILTAALVVVLLLVAAGAMTWWTQRRSTAQPVAAPVATTCPDATLHVTAAPEIAPVVQAAARKLNSGGAACGPIAVTAEEPALTVTAARKPDVWIPSSSAWLHMVGAGDAAYVTEGQPLARSPIVLAAPPAVARLIGKDGRTSWSALVAGTVDQRIPAVTMPDPLHSTVGLLSVHAVHAALGRATPDAGVAQMRALTLRSRLKDAAADPAQVLHQVGALYDPTAAAYDYGVFPVTEQQLTTYQRGAHEVQLDGAYPTDGPIDADYPFAVAEPARSDELVTELRAAISKAALVEAGFRTAPTPKAVTLPADRNGLLEIARQWAQYRTLPFQVLLLIDGSGSMNERITDRAGRSITKAALLRESGVNASQLFGEDTSIGMWFFASPAPGSPAHVEAVPVGPITTSVNGRPRRDLLATKLAGYRAADAAGTPLYQTVLDGQAKMRPLARPGAATVIVVLTDGDDRGSRFAMSEQTFRAKLTAQQDLARRVPIIAVGYGPDADMKALTGMATATGGKAIAATNPADLSAALAQAFLAAHS